MAHYLKVYIKHPIDCIDLKKLLNDVEQELEIKIVQGEDDLGLDIFKQDESSLSQHNNERTLYGVLEHRHIGYDYWHPVVRVHAPV